MVNDGRERFTIPATPEQEESPDSAVFRKGKTWVVWDDRGLVIRAGGPVYTTQFEGITVSPKVFKKEEILFNIEFFKSGTRFKTPSLLAGSLRVGSEIFFLPRWEDKDGKPWLEALFSVNLEDNPPRPKYVGKFVGFTTAYKPIDDEIFVEGEKIGVVTAQGESWGVSTLPLGTTEFESEILGSNLISYHKHGLFVEQSTYGTSFVGGIDFKTLRRRNLAEVKGVNFNFLPSSSDLLWSQTGDQFEALSLATGATLSLKGEYAIRPVGKYVVLWKPSEKITGAVLLSPDRWTVVARWKRTTGNIKE